MESRRLISPALLYSHTKDTMTKITINLKNFYVSDCTESDGVITGRCDETYDELTAAARDGLEVYVDDAYRGRITYSWFPISGQFQIYI